MTSYKIDNMLENEKGRFFTLIYSKIFYCVIFLSLIISLTIKFVFIYYQFCHVDDILVLDRVLNWKMHGFWKYIELNFMYNWTYAPMQFLLTGILVSSDFSNELNIVLGRLPSLIFTMLTIYFMYIVLKCKFHENKHLIVFGFVCIAMSWEMTVYSAQMEPYAISCMVVTLFMYLSRTKVIWCEKDFYRYCILFSVACYAHYQIAIFFIAFFLAYIVLKYKEESIFFWRVYLKGFCISVFCFIPLIYKYYTLSVGQEINYLTRGINWNVGIGNIFLFKIKNDSLVDQISYVFQYFSENTFYCLKYFLLPDLMGSNLLAGMFFLIFLTGIISCFIKKDRYSDNDIISLTFAVALLVFVILILKEKMVLGPSRHTMILIPVFIYFMCQGFQYISRYTNKKIVDVLIYGSVIFIIFGGVYVFPSEVSNRFNYYSQNRIEKIIDEYDAKLFVPYAYSSESKTFSNFHGFKIISNDPDGDFGIYGLITRNELNPGDIVIFSSRSMKMSETYFNECINLIKVQYPNIYASDFIFIKGKEIDSTQEVEYASEFYKNYPNGFHLYLYRYIGACQKGKY